MKEKLKPTGMVLSTRKITILMNFDYGLFYAPKTFLVRNKLMDTADYETFLNLAAITETF